MESESKQSIHQSIVQIKEMIGPLLLGETLTLHCMKAVRQAVNGSSMITLPPLPMFDQGMLLVALNQERLCSRVQYIIQMHRVRTPGLI